MDSDEVNSIADTPESLQVAQIVKSVYEELMANKNWPHLRTLFTLNASGDSNKPTHMKSPDDLKELELLKYNKIKTGETKARYQDVIFLHPDEFLIKLNNRNSDHDDVDVISDFSGVELLIKTEKAPEYWTSFDDEWLVFDSYDSTVDATLQSSKTQLLGFRWPVFTLSDEFVPDLPQEAFPMLLAEAKSTCFARIKQMPDAKSEQQATRSKNWMSRKAWQNAGGIRFPDYGRKSRKGRR
jgi:hypothetical protein